MRRKKLQAKDIAKKRIAYLYALAKKTFFSDKQLSRTAIRHLRAIATKHNLRITKEKRTFCKSCNTLLVAGSSARVRIHPHHKSITCISCSTIKRIGFSAR